MADLASYIRHGRRFGVDDEFWQTAASDLEGAELRRLAAELDAKLPNRWATTPNRPSEPAPQAGSTANKSRSWPTGRGESVSSGERPLTCECGTALGSMNTTGQCRTCYQRDLMRSRRGARAA